MHCLKSEDDFRKRRRAVEDGVEPLRATPPIRRRNPLIALIALFLLLPGPARELTAERRDFGDIKVENLGLPNWMGEDYAPHISPDGRFLVFQSDRPGSSAGLNLWFTINTNHRRPLEKPGWTVPLPFYLPMIGKASVTMRIQGGRYVLKKPAGAVTVNSDGFEGMPFVVYEGENPREVYFSSLRDEKSGRPGYAGLNLYVIRYTNERWSQPRHLNIVNGDFDDSMPSLSADGRSLYFVSNRPGGYGGDDIWLSRRDSPQSPWSRPINVGPPVNTEHNEIAPVNTWGGGVLIFSSDRPGGFGHYDFYASRLRDGAYQKPKNLGSPFNTNRDDETMTLTSDGLWAYFSSDRRNRHARGRLDLYRARLPAWLRETVNITFSGLVLDGRSGLPLGVEATLKIGTARKTIVVVSRAFNKAPDVENAVSFSILLDSGKRYPVLIEAPGYHPEKLVLDYTGIIPSHRTDRRQIVLQPLEKRSVKIPARLRRIDGRLVDGENGKKRIENGVVVLKVEGEAAEIIRADSSGKFQIEVPVKSSFEITGRAPGYADHKLNFQEDPELKTVVIPLKKIKEPPYPCAKDTQACLDRIVIHFDVNRYDIRQQELPKLNKIVRIMRRFPGVAIEILGHADITYFGPRKKAFTYNKELSELRARSVKGALLRLGITDERLQITGKSYTVPLCRENTPDCLQRNRRVEFIRIPTPKKTE